MCVAIEETPHSHHPILQSLVKNVAHFVSQRASGGGHNADTTLISLMSLQIMGKERHRLPENKRERIYSDEPQ